MECYICGKEITPDFHLLHGGKGVCFHCAAYLEGVTKMKEEQETPFCCGQKMNATYRYMDKGVVYRSFICNNPGCKRRVTVEWENKETVGQEIIRKRLERGDIVKGGLIYKKGGENK